MAPAFDLSCLFEHHFGYNRSDIILNDGAKADSERADRLIKDVDRMIAGYPLQYILGKWEFMGLRFYVGPGVLIPRPDTETLAQTAIDIMQRVTSGCLADLCAGSGAVAISAARLVPGITADAFEISDDALMFLNKNNELHGNVVNVIKADVLMNPDIYEKYDCITANPPYITEHDMESLSPQVKHEPYIALCGGRDGLDFYRAITALWRDSLKKDGWMLFEIGMGQHDDVKNIMQNSGYEDIFFKQDLSGIIRVVGGRKRKM